MWAGEGRRRAGRRGQTGGWQRNRAVEVCTDSWRAKRGWRPLGWKQGVGVTDQEMGWEGQDR